MRVASSLWVLSLPPRRYLALAVGVLAAVWIARGECERSRRACPGNPHGNPHHRVDTAAADAHHLVNGLARAHPSWVGEHGAGCARTAEHLLPYTSFTSTIDPWGSPVALTCDRTRPDHIVARVRSFGPDRVRGTTDDLVGTSVHDDR
jgi:hypothetical protein